MIDKPQNENENEEEFELDDSNQMDDDTYQDEDDFDFDEELGEDYSLTPDDQPQATPKSSINWFNIIIFGGLALIILAVAAIYLPNILGGSKNSTPTEQASSGIQLQKASSESNKMLAEEAVSNGISDEIAQSGGLLANPNMLKDGSNIDYIEKTAREREDELFSGVNNPNSVPDKQDSRKTSENLDIVEVEPKQQPLPTPADFAAAEGSMPIQKLDDDITFDPIDTQSIAAEKTLSQTQVTEMQAANAQLMQKVESLTDYVSTLETKLENQAQQNDNSDVVKTLEEKIKQLESRLENAEADKAKTTSEPDEAKVVATRQAMPIEAKSTETEDSQAQQDAKPASDNVFEASVASTSNREVENQEPSQSRVMTEAPTAMNPPAQNEVDGWVLRGASPGQAYLADTSNGAVSTVNIGDTLKGLGQITSIALEDNQWVVRGTKGIVRQ